MTQIGRRNFAGAMLLAGTGCARGPRPGVNAPKSAVAILRAPNYAAELASSIERGARACGLRVKDKTVLLKPNLVEFDRSTSINTDVAVLAAAVEVFEKMGAREVWIGEGPGHRRDTLHLAGEAGYRALPHFENRFVDLNCDDVAAVNGFGLLEKIYLPKTALAADLIVSLAKMKTHHWAGATLAMKNLFGLVPGAVYGWPKNQLHYIGIPESIAGLNRIFRKTFAIVDGIVGMEGNGPIQGSPKPCGVLVMGGDLVAVDATCARIMGLNPQRLKHLDLARDLGQIEEERIEQRGESIHQVRTPFAVNPEFNELRLLS